MARLKEQRSWDNFKTAIDTSKLKCIRIENAVGEGMADVIVQNRVGRVIWLENKALDNWPARAKTCPLHDAFEPGQLPFLRGWVQWGGHAFVLLRVDRLHYLIDPIDPIREMTSAQLQASAILTGKMTIVRYLEQL